MAHYLVHATPIDSRLSELEQRLEDEAFIELQPFGRALSQSLKNARREADGFAVWEEEDYCTPPLREEREAVLDDYFEDIEVERVEPGAGWKRIQALPRLFPGLE